jgi:hypothetical protein
MPTSQIYLLEIKMKENVELKEVEEAKELLRKITAKITGNVESLLETLPPVQEICEILATKELDEKLQLSFEEWALRLKDMFESLINVEGHCNAIKDDLPLPPPKFLKLEPNNTYRLCIIAPPNLFPYYHYPSSPLKTFRVES